MLQILLFYLRNIILFPFFLLLKLVPFSHKKVKKPQKLLIICLSGMGNYIMCTPAIESIKKAYPKAHIDMLLGAKVNAYLAKNDPAIQEVFLANGKQIWELREKQYDLCVTLYPAGVIDALYAFIIGAKIKIGHTFPAGFLCNRFPYDICVKEEKVHDIKNNGLLLKKINIPLHQDQRLHVNIKKLHKTAKWVGFHPGCNANQPWKRWPHYPQLIQEIKNKYQVNTKVLLGPDEKELASQFENAIVGKKIDEVISIIAHCDLFISNDSGLMHVADALNIPTIAIIGPTVAYRTAPMGKKSFVVQSNKHGIYDFRRPFTQQKKALSLLHSIKTEKILNLIQKNKLL